MSTLTRGTEMKILSGHAKELLTPRSDSAKPKLSIPSLLNLQSCLKVYSVLLLQMADHHTLWVAISSSLPAKLSSEVSTFGHHEKQMPDYCPEDAGSQDLIKVIPE